eukprot:NODE_1342_length_1544_cov_33.366267_g1270_i0.p1 GENE.NODE_1342_length_1544_cov_33.366267_g1270_i0~~NODE_1342_length_1544_cov_33.366267_g1270_i0.p1  ORF type:complete len:438 (-),score=125.81 NODE_1342_length_1544_cov_33.366267_g1270_i0:231-1502(-)
MPGSPLSVRCHSSACVEVQRDYQLQLLAQQELSSALRQQLHSLRNELKDLKHDYRQVCSRHDVLGASLLQLGRVHQELDDTHAVCLGAALKGKAQVIRHKESAKRSALQLDEYSQWLCFLHTEWQGWQRAHTLHSLSLSEATQQLHQTESKCRRLDAELHSKTVELSLTTERLEAATAQFAALEQTCATLRSEVSASAVRLDTSQRTLQSTTATNQQLRLEVETFREFCADHEGIKSNLGRCTAENIALRQQLAEVKKRNSALSGELHESTEATRTSVEAVRLECLDQAAQERRTHEERVVQLTEHTAQLHHQLASLTQQLHSAQLRHIDLGTQCDQWKDRAEQAEVGSRQLLAFLTTLLDQTKEMSGAYTGCQHSPRPVDCETLKQEFSHHLAVINTLLLGQSQLHRHHHDHAYHSPCHLSN